MLDSGATQQGALGLRFSGHLTGRLLGFLPVSPIQGCWSLRARSEAFPGVWSPRFTVPVARSLQDGNPMVLAVITLASAVSSVTSRLGASTGSRGRGHRGPSACSSPIHSTSVYCGCSVTQAWRAAGHTDMKPLVCSSTSWGRWMSTYQFPECVSLSISLYVQISLSMHIKIANGGKFQERGGHFHGMVLGGCSVDV